MPQHFLLSASVRTLSLVQVARMSEEQAEATFRAIRWHETGGELVCPECGCCAVYAYRTRKLWKCKGCGRQFSLTSGTIFHSRKLPVHDYLMAIAIFVNAAKGISALQLGRDLDVSYKTAFVLAHKLREAMMADQAKYRPQGGVEADGCHIGGHVKPANRKERRKDRRLAENRTGDGPATSATGITSRVGSPAHAGMDLCSSLNRRGRAPGAAGTPLAAPRAASGRCRGR